MHPCSRGPAPQLLQLHGSQIGEEYSARRKADPSYRFQWPQRDGQSLYQAAFAGLVKMTEQRCAYCDGHPISATGEDQIDHFRPKSRPEFYVLVCSWENLFLICSACNKAKGDSWDEALLRPDEEGFHFLRFFSYRTDTGEIEPNPGATPAEQNRARRSIEIFDLNRGGACTMRKRTLKEIISAHGESDLNDFSYRYLIPLVRGSLTPPR